MMTKGGKREGAGKPALYDEPMKRVNAMIRDIDTALLVELAGSRSAGIRFLCDHWRSLTQRGADLLKAGRNLPAKKSNRKGSAPA